MWSCEQYSITKCLSNLTVWEEMGTTPLAANRKLITIQNKAPTAKKSQETMEVDAIQPCQQRKNLPQGKTTAETFSDKCFACGLVGHHRRDCPTEKKKKAGRQSMAAVLEE